ncbi:hypothetical protein N9D07_02415 [Alphaproteobacteria bacterium]|nr:hypothetical protein [Alphaproteobacteria bacterium]
MLNRFCIGGLLLFAATSSSVVSASTYNASDSNFQPLKLCTLNDRINATKTVGPLVFGHRQNAYPVCVMATWSNKTCKKGEWHEGQSGELTELNYKHDYDYDENSLQITNPYDWTITSINFEYRKINGTIIYELKLENLNIKKSERALITNLPNKYKFYNIKNIKVAGPKKAICNEYFSDEEIEEKETSALLNKQKNEGQKKREVKAESAASQTKIFTNCIEDKMPPNPDKTYKLSILSICERASETPTLWNKIWYDYLGQ